jgi:hypothetical protein
MVFVYLLLRIFWNTQKLRQQRTFSQSLMAVFKRKDFQSHIALNFSFIEIASSEETIREKPAIVYRKSFNPESLRQTFFSQCRVRKKSNNKEVWFHINHSKSFECSCRKLKLSKARSFIHHSRSSPVLFPKKNECENQFPLACLPSY